MNMKQRFLDSNCNYNDSCIINGLLIKQLILAAFVYNTLFGIQHLTY